MDGISNHDDFAVTSLEALDAIYKKPADGVLRKVSPAARSSPPRRSSFCRPRPTTASTARPREMRPASFS